MEVYVKREFLFAKIIRRFLDLNFQLILYFKKVVFVQYHRVVIHRNLFFPIFYFDMSKKIKFEKEKIPLYIMGLISFIVALIEF